MVHKDLRDWLADVEHDGELKRISGADWNVEMGGITELVNRYCKQVVLPALLFDDIPGYARGYRVLYNQLASTRRVARALCLPFPDGPIERLDLVKGWITKSADVKLIPPKFVASGPVQKNLLSEDEVDLMKFPVPKSHELDGGRYIGAGGHALIVRDPDEGWVNIGTYRTMMVDSNRMAVMVAPERHHIRIRNKYFDRGQVMPVAFVIGADPTLGFVAGVNVPWGVSEYDYAGGLKGEPIEVFKGPYTGLPLPATAEVVIEGECHPGELTDEGPYGEYSGHYAEGLDPIRVQVIRAKKIFYRDDPIIISTHAAMPPSAIGIERAFVESALLWTKLTTAGVRGIKGVYFMESGQGALIGVVSIQQMYAGHSKEAGFLASQLAGHDIKWTIVVDNDIDPSNVDQVIWAVATRANPENAIQFQRGCRTSKLDSTISPEEKRKVEPEPPTATKVVIDACRPYEWRDEWYPVVRVSPELEAHLRKKWESLFKEV